MMSSSGAVRTLLVLVAILIGLVVGLAAGMHSRFCGKPRRVAVREGCIAFGATVPLVILIMKELHLL
jgi:hypothetical protein